MDVGKDNRAFILGGVSFCFRPDFAVQPIEGMVCRIKHRQVCGMMQRFTSGVWQEEDAGLVVFA
jgi:hypothetical protein